MQGNLTQRDGQWQLEFTRTLPHPPEKVWRALTEPEHLAAWFPTAIDGERAAGAPLRFIFPNGTGPTIDGEMLVYDLPAILEFRWGQGETLRFELQPDGEHTVLTFSSCFDELGKAARDGAGWHTCLDVLAAHLDGEAPPWTTNERWRHVHAEYVERFGPEASTFGPPV